MGVKACRGQERASDLELELQVVGSCSTRVLGTESESPAKALCVLNH